MFDVFNMIFDCIESVFDTLDSSEFVSIAGVGVSLGDMLWGFFILSVIFTFFLVPRVGSGLGGVGNVLTFMRDDFNREIREQRRQQNEAQRQAQYSKRQSERQSEYARRQAERNSYESYAARRKQNSEYFARYNKENNIKPGKKGDK